MRKFTIAALLIATALSVTGCGSMGKLFGGTDDTVLPGKREDAIPGHSKFPEAGDTGAPATSTVQNDAGAPDMPPPVDCTNPKNKKDPACVPADASGDGTFSDGQ